MSRGRPRPPFPAALAVLLLAAFAAPAAAKVQLDRKPVEVKYHTFDPRNRPAGMPTLSPGEAAVCVSRFGASAKLQYSQTTRHEVPGKYSAEIVVDEVRVEMTLQIDVWLPEGASDKLRAHEEGHRQIAERVYAEAADRAALAAAATVDGRRFRAEAATAEKAETAAAAALTKPQEALIQSYLDGTSRAAQKVQEAYDRITEHGTRIEVTEADAIRQAWAQHTPPMAVPPATAGAATRPATRSAAGKGTR